MKDNFRERVDLVFSSGALIAADVAARTLKFLDVRDAINLYGTSMSISKALTTIEKSNKPNFNIESQNHSVHFSTLKSHHLQLLSITGKMPCMMKFWENLVDFYSSEYGFIQACVLNEHYSYWQNAQDPLQYEAAERSIENLRFISNELPPPLNQAIIDTTSNPGRILVSQGYIEMIGNIMWFGDKFPQVIDDEKISLLLKKFDGILVERERNSTKIVVMESSFDEKTSEELQDRLRNVIYG
ncbi:hypothetical protein [Xanthomonas campestris]|uniref:hypothetical protein n=1 Tax=Xanthomonas campestris TaxID=339 RepID=UPI001CC0FDFD|nr:hypothetical protein [Xanthomonas campestris]MEA9733344.1 hypothetical protein [Xanthomonas campestris]UAU36359.1 hypothetical protein JH290_09695 [Xanthomonas campestris pv. incanae]